MRSTYKAGPGLVSKARTATFRALSCGAPGELNYRHTCTLCY